MIELILGIGIGIVACELYQAYKHPAEDTKIALDWTKKFESRQKELKGFREDVIENYNNLLNMIDSEISDLEDEQWEM